MLEAIVISVGYVLSVYATSDARLPRDDPRSIRARMLAITIYTAVVIAMGPWILGSPTWKWTPELLAQTGIWPTAKFAPIAKAVGVTAALFIGPLILNKGRFPNPYIEVARDLVVGPITEELVFRGLVATLTPGSIARKVALNPLYFGIAHIHHGIILWRSGESFYRVVLITTLHTAMTGLFAAYSTYLFLRTGSLWAALVAHIYCNWQGPPSLSGPVWYRALLVVGIGTFVVLLPYV